MEKPRRLLGNAAWTWVLMLGLVLNGRPRVSAQTSAAPQSLCRSREKMLSIEAYRFETCALCYQYMPLNQFNVFPSVAEELPKTRKWHTTDNTPHLVDGFNITWLVNSTGEMMLADIYSNDTISLLQSSFVNEHAQQLWTWCCEAAEECCQQIQIPWNPEDGVMTFQNSSSGCPQTWDGWQCWPEGGVPGEVMTQSCARHVFFHTNGGGTMEDSCGKYVEKTCNSSGQWLTRANGEWTNYTTCSPHQEFLTQDYVLVSLYGLSVIALLPAIIIFFSYKVLRVPRIAIHKNLFGSLLFHCLTMIIFKCLVLLPFIQNIGGQQTMLKKNTWSCRLLVMLSKYFRLTNYTWMYCEGYYLHRLLANTFEEERSLKVILLIGWGLPVVPCLIYGIIRIFVDNSLCWVLPVEAYGGLVEWIYMTPGLLCILANMVYFINIFRILVTKLQAPHANEPAHFRKAVHATVVLLPLFGLHWLLTLYRPQEGANCHWQTFYKYLNICLDGLQGLMVSIAFCYRNGEIRYLLNQSKKRFRDRFFPESNTSVHFQMKERNRKSSDTCFTQVGYTTVATTASQFGSRDSLQSGKDKSSSSQHTHSPSSNKVPHKQAQIPNSKTVLEVRTSTYSTKSADSV
ncbi:calcitonin gene-related peptide type 1 receptor-like isoform X2 [Tigriopus californicus]|uniref:calcitonin gene-related peptide type 1 receptor-like isoform X2 n=1 Tax=Tigriopus californicus TaxID=6832 RepID=UPI0027DA2258|nr:calcitonin gene-related peptide type 1 receptor-like isoform X2 [Tigriopus californicus]